MLKSSQDTDALQSVSTTSLDTDAIQKISSSVNNYSESSVNSIEGTPAIIKDNFASKDSLLVNSHSISSAQTVSLNDSCTLPIVSNNNSIVLKTTKEITESLYKSNLTQTETLRSVSHQTIIRGRRIIDFEYFFNALKRVNQHSKSGCSLNDIIITDERRSGLCTSYCVKCTVCNFQDIIWSECPNKYKNINADTVAGMLSINLAMNKLLCKMDLPASSNATLIKEHYHNLSDEIKGGTKVTDKSLNFPITDDKFSKESGKSSESSLLIDAHLASTLPKKTSKTFLNNHTQEQKPKPISDQASASSDKSKSCEQFDFNGLLVKDEFEIEVSDTDCADESVGILPVELKAPDDNLIIGTEQATFDTTRIKKEIDSDVFDDKLIGPEASEVEVLSNNSFLKCANPSPVMSSPHQKIVNAYEDNMVADKEQVKLDATVLKQEIQDDSDLCESIDIETNEGRTIKQKHNESAGKNTKRKLYLIFDREKMDKSKFSSMETFANKKRVVCCLKNMAGSKS